LTIDDETIQEWNSAWRKKHGDKVIKLNGVWYSEQELNLKRARAIKRSDLLYRRLCGVDKK